LFTIDREEIFEDGMESDFSKELFYAIQKYGDPVIEILAELMDYEGVNIEIASEAMRWLGHIDHPPTYNKRLWLLERSLQHDSARVRDGALLGLSSLDDPDAIPYLKEAIETEKCKELREDMERTLLELENLERIY
ncbi:MAG: HEAT repeat domain-containing protein, partial [Candidatus Poribacteria bacterium]